MKILVVCQYYYPEPFRITDICEELAKRGHQVTVLTGLPNYPEGKILKEYKKKEHRDEVRNGVRIIRCYEHGRGKNPISLLWNFFSFALSGKRKVKKLDKDFDLVFINQLSPVMMAWPGIKYAKKYGKRSTLYCYDLWPASLATGGIKQSSLFYKLFNKISKRVYNSVDHICVTSRGFADYLSNEHGISKDRISYLPQYCEDIFGMVEDEPHPGLNFVFAGNVGQTQSVQTIIKAASLLKEKKDITIHIVGDGRDLDNCKNLASKLETNNVVFHGRKPIEEMPRFYAMADAMIVTMSKDELISKTLPGKIQSYMAAGKPIVAAANGEVNALIKESKCGLVCEAEDYSSLATNLCRFSEKSLSELAGTNSKKYYLDHFTKSAFFEGLKKTINI